MNNQCEICMQGNLGGKSAIVLNPENSQVQGLTFKNSTLFNGETSFN